MKLVRSLDSMPLERTASDRCILSVDSPTMARAKRGRLDEPQETWEASQPPEDWCAQEQQQLPQHEECKFADEHFGFYNYDDVAVAVAASSSPRRPSPRKRSGLFQALQCAEEDAEASSGGSEGDLRQLTRCNAAMSAPELFRRSKSRSVLSDIECTEPGEFRKCRHCKSVFPYIKATEQPLSSREALRFSFCSGECHLTYVTLYHHTRQNSRRQRQLKKQQQQQQQQHENDFEQQQQRLQYGSASSLKQAAPSPPQHVLAR